MTGPAVSPGPVTMHHPAGGASVFHTSFAPVIRCHKLNSDLAAIASAENSSNIKRDKPWD